MRYSISCLYRHRPPQLEHQLAEAISRGLARADGRVQLFFRADDIGVVSRQFAQMIALFQQHALPLCLATVPSWLTQNRLSQLRNITGMDDSLWCWHQHGRLHRNFEPHGKKQEFGPARDTVTIRNQLRLGKERLEILLEDAFQPFFTPPWNRCSLKTILALQELHFKGLSRSYGATPAADGLLPDLQVQVDLHTRKELAPQQGFANLLDEIETGLASGRCGIMLHHQRMNQHACDLLDILLGLLAQARQVSPRRFSEMVP